MKKRFLILLMSVAMTVSTFAGGNTLTVRAESDSSKSETPSIDGKTYYLREDSAALISALGDGYEYSEMVSPCTIP